MRMSLLGCMPDLGTVEANPVGFYHVLYMLSNATVQNTRPFRREVVTLMSNDPVMLCSEQTLPNLKTMSMMRTT